MAGRLRLQIVLILLVLMVTACAGHQKPETLILDNRDASGKYTRIYTRAALLPTDKKHPDISDFLMFFVNKDELGIMLFSSSKSVAEVPQVSLSIDGQVLPLLAQEKIARNSRKRFRHGLFYPVSRQYLQKLSSAKKAILTIERKGAYQGIISNSIKDRLSLLLVSSELVTRGKQWSNTSKILTSDAGAWLKRLTIYKFERSRFGEDVVDVAARQVPTL